MNKELQRMPPMYGGDTDELVGVLTAISVVSKRLARRLTVLERRSSEKECDDTDEPNERAVPAYANPRRAI